MTLTQQIRNAIDAPVPVWQRLNAIRALVGLPPAKRGRRPGAACPKEPRPTGSTAPVNAPAPPASLPASA